MNTPNILHNYGVIIIDLYLEGDNYHHLAQLLSCSEFNELIEYFSINYFPTITFDVIFVLECHSYLKVQLNACLFNCNVLFG